MIAYLRTRKSSIFLLLIDLIMAIGGLSAAYYFRFPTVTPQLTNLAVALVFIMTASIYITNGYHLKKNLTIVELARRSLLAFVIGFAVSSAFIYVMGRDYYDPFRGRGVLATTFVIFYFATFIVRVICLKTMQRFGGVLRRWLLISSAKAYEELQFDCNLAQVDEKFQWLDNATLSADKLDQYNDDLDWLGVIVENDEDSIKRIGNELGQWRFDGLTLMSIAEFDERYLGMVSLPQLWPGWFLDASGFTLARPSLARRTKALFDYVIAAITTIFLLPFFVLIAIAIKLDSNGPVFYRQVRVGVNHVPYRIFKFRSMRVDAEKDGAKWASKNDTRVTRVGAILRKFRLDELPQLFNVLLGDMSLIGPRPERPEFVENLNEEIPYYEIRHLVKPGITGWAQVRYPYGQSTEDAKRKLQYDLYYIKHYSPMLEILIVIRTIRIMLKGSGQ